MRPAAPAWSITRAATAVGLALASLVGGCGSHGRSQSAPQEGPAGETAANNGALARGGIVSAHDGVGSNVASGGGGAGSGRAMAEAASVATTPGGARTVSVKNALFEFDYSYPAAVGGIASLKAVLDRRADAARAALQAEASEAREQVQADGLPYRTHSSGTQWKVVANVPGWLSLSAETYSYSGGAHGMTGFDALVWDKDAAMARRPIDLFASPALVRAVRTDWCAAIDRQRARKRGEPVRRGTDPTGFDACLDPVANSTVILGSSNGRTFDRIGFLVPPYNAGPYAEGSYEVTLPITPAVMAAVKPPFRDAFATRD